METTSTRLRQLDGLRALAVSLVVVYHLGAARLASSLVGAGHVFLGNMVGLSTSSGVELFFVLSGVVLLRPHLREGRPLDVGAYIQRRIQRLWPPYLAAWLLAGFVTWLADICPTEWTKGADIAAFSMESWLFQVGILYFGGNSFNPAWWSLSVELLFYALVPVVVLAAVRLRGVRANWVGVWLLSIAVALATQQIPQPTLPSYLLPFVRLATYSSCFATGILIASNEPPRSWAKPLAIVGISYSVAACRWPALNPHIGWGLSYFSLIIVALDGSSKPARTLRKRHWVWLGERSYSLFLVHISVFTLVNHGVSSFVPSKGLAYYGITRLVEVPLALLVSMTIFTMVERRFASGLVSADSFWPWIRTSEPPRTPYVPSGVK